MTALLDRLLGPRFGHEAGEGRRRGRLIVGAHLLLMSSCLFGMGLTLLYWREMFPLASAGLVLQLANLWVLRRTGRLELAAIGMCLIIFTLAVSPSWKQGGIDNDILDWVVAICVFAPTLMATRASFFFVGLAALSPLALWLSARAGHVFAPMNNEPVVMVGSQIAMTTLIGTFAWFQERSRRDAVAARDRAMASLEESREARVALIENLDAVIYSVDRDLRLIAGNARFDELCHSTGNPPLVPGQPVLDGLAESQRDALRKMFARALAGEHFTVERRIELRSGVFECEVLFNPIRRASGEVRGVTVFGRDISERKRAEAELERAHRELAEAAHLAGKAEVATDVLHNVGNILTVINSGASLVLEQLRASKLPFLRKAVALMPSAPDELARFLTGDEKGRQIPKYLRLLADSLDQERAESMDAMEALDHQLDHMKSVVARQQAFAHAGSLVEIVAVEELVAEALRMNEASLQKHGIAVTSEIAALPQLVLDRHKLLEIIVNFIVNSRQSLAASKQESKLVEVRAFRNLRGNLQIDISDNGVGIAKQNLERLFSYGFTTKPEGHGFGLAGSLLAARSMGGTASGSSDGPDHGATFSVEVPYQEASASPLKERAA